MTDDASEQDKKKGICSSECVVFKLLCGYAVSLWLSQLAVFIDLGHVLRNERTEILRSCVSDNGLFL
jgi:hypothetical protein